MAGRVRAHDWAATPLGPVEAWPQSLRTAVDMVLAMPGPANILWGPAGVQIYNDAYAAAVARDRHPGLLGRPVAEGWPQAYEEVLAPLLDAARAGRATRLAGHPVTLRTPDGGWEERVFDTDWSPVRDAPDAEHPQGAVAGALEILVDVTDRHRAEAALRESEGRHAFLVRLGDALRPLRDAAEIPATATRLLGEHLGASRVAYVEVSGDEYVIACDYTDGVPSMAGRYPIVSFGPGKLAEYRAGRTRVVHDTRADPHNSAPDNASFAAVGVGAGIGVPLVKEGAFVANLVVHMDVPRNWIPEEVALVEETADRTWAAVERARAEAALRESEERYRVLFESIDEGFCTVEVLFDGRDGAGGKACDYRFLQVNPAFERQTGLVAAVGRTMRELAPAHEEHWFETYGRIALTGEPVRFEHRADALGRWYEVYAFRIGRPEERRVAILFRDVLERKRAEAALRESEERLALAFRTLPVGIAVVDAAGETVMANDEMRRFLPTGRIPSRDPGRSARWRGWDADGEIVRPKDFPGARALRGEVVSPGMQMLFRDDGGAEIWTEVLSRPLRGADERINGAITVVIDVNRIKRSEEVARASEERLRRFGEASQDILWIRDADTLQWVYLTPAFEAIYGLSREEALTGDNYRVWQDLIVPDDRDHAIASIKRVGAGERATFEYRIRRPMDGQVRWLRNTDFPMHDGAGRVVRIGGIGHDITELKAAQAAMAESETRLRTLAEGIPQLVWRSDDDGRWTWSSPQWQAFTGQSQEASHGRGWLDAVHPDDREAAMRAWHEARPHGRLDAEYRVRRASDGAWLWHRTRSVPVRDAPGADGAEGRILEWLGTTTDIDDLKRLQGQQRVLVAELQHRTRNLLAVVRNVARRSIDPSLSRDEYDARLAALGRVQGFLSRSPLHAVPLADLVGAELKATGDGLSEKVAVEGPAVELPGEGVQAVALALHELATNAVKYGALAQPSGRLSVTWRVEGDDGAGRLVIDWRESGVVMPDGAPARRGYGSELITEALPYQLSAETELEFTPDGVRCRIVLPVGAFGGSEGAHA